MTSTSQNYKLWSDVVTKPQSLQTKEEILKYLANAGILAVSTHNTQPWLIKIEDSSILVYPDFSKKLPYGDPQHRGIYISLGAYVQTAVLAATALGIETNIVRHDSYWEINCKKLSVTKKPNLELLTAISQRFSDKTYYLEKKVPKKSLLVLTQQVSTFPVDFVYTSNKSVIDYLSEQYLSAAGEMARERSFRQELASWLRPNRTSKKDGMPGFTAGVPLLLSYLGPYVLPLLPQAAQIQVKKDAHKLKKAPVVGVVVSPTNSKSDWFETGRLYTQLAISAIQMDIHMTPMAAFIENEPYQEKLRKVFDFPRKSRPQMFFRLGYSDTSVIHTPRRRVV